MEQKRENPQDYTSDEDTDNESTNYKLEDKMNTAESSPQQKPPEEVSNNDGKYDDCTLESDVTKQADELEKSLDAAVAQLQEDTTSENNDDELQQQISVIVKTLIQDELHQYCQEYNATSHCSSKITRSSC